MRAKESCCTEGQCEQPFRFTLMKLLFLQFHGSTFPTSIVYSCKVNDTTRAAEDRDNGGLKTPGLPLWEQGVHPGHLPLWTVTFCWPQSSPLGLVQCSYLLCFIPEAAVSGASALIFIIEP